MDKWATDSEMDIVLAAARPLAVRDRDGFLKEVAERLAGHARARRWHRLSDCPRRAAQAFRSAAA
jgi:hypothetical protein